MSKGKLAAQEIEGVFSVHKTYYLFITIIFYFANKTLIYTF